MRAKWEQFQKEVFDPYIWIFTNGEIHSVNDTLWARKIKQTYFNFKIKKEIRNESAKSNQ